jgi:tetratricopeptide (TPR) repeat protein
MDISDPQGPSQRFEYVRNSAVSNEGSATNYNIAGDQYLSFSVQSQPWTPPVMLLLRAQSFVGREEDLAWLLEQLQDDTGKTIALCGLGGMGKTALAAEALARLVAQPDWMKRFPGGIFSYSFYPNPSLDVAFEEVARIFGEDPGADPRRAAIRALSRRRTILVFDGVEVLADVRPLRELGGRHIVLLLSRRQSDALDVAHRLTLNLLTQEQGIQLLKKQAGQRAADRSCAEQLVQKIGGYPLALQLIGSYLSSGEEEITEYLQWLEQEGLKALFHSEDQTQRIRVLLQRTYDSLTPHEQSIFALLGLLAPAPFSFALVQGILDLPERAIRRALNSLVNLSVLRRPQQEYEVSHALVHAFAVELLSLREHVISSSSAVNHLMTAQERLLNTLITHVQECDPYDRAALTLWLPHVLTLLSTLSAEPLMLSAASLFKVVGFVSLTQGRYTEAELLLKRALQISEQQLGAAHPDTATSLNNLATLHYHQGKYEEAEPLYERALQIREQQLGAAHPETASSLNNLAALYRAQGKYEEAEPLYERALQISEQQLGPEHPDTATSLNNLAELYQAQGKYEEAEPLYERALQIREQQLGPEHPATATSLNNLALLCYHQGKYAEAEPLYERALQISEQQLGPEHPATASSLNNLANLYQAQGKYEEAKPLLKRVLQIREQQLGPEHPDTATSLNNLAELYQAQGKYEEAEPLLKRALQIREQQLGPEHPDTATSLNNLATLHYHQGKYEEAEPLYERALQIREQQLGAAHPDTASSLNNLANLYQAQGKYEEAKPLLKLQISEQQLGPEHPDTATSLNNLAELYQAQEKYEEAEPLLKRALQIREQQLGPEHPATATSLNNLALLCYHQGKYEEAEPLYERALQISEQQLGPEHPDMASGLNNLALLYYYQGKHEEVEPLLKRVLQIRERQLGLVHPDTGVSLNNLALLYYHQGKYAEAKPLYQRALAIVEQQLGSDHLTTQTFRANYTTLRKAMGGEGALSPTEI